MKRSLLAAFALLVVLNGTLLGQTQFTLDGINPTQTTAGGPTFTMGLVVSNMPAGTVRVLFNGTLLSATLVGNQITAQIPTGLILNSGTVNVAVSVQFANGGSVFSTTLPFTINPPPMITTTTLNAMTVGVFFSQTLAASQGTPPYSNWLVVAGLLPAGLTLNVNTGVINGTPIAPGLNRAEFSVNDSAGVSAFTLLTWSVSVAPLAITTNSPLPNATSGTSYPQQTFAVTGGFFPYTWSSSGALPPGLTLSTAGVLSGTPTRSGTYNFTVLATDAANSFTTKAFTLTVNAAPLTITTASPLPNATAAAAYSQVLAVAGGISPYTWSSTGALPSGLILSTAGTLSGTPTRAGTFNFTVGVADSSGGSTSKAFSLTVGAPALTIANASPLPNAAVAAAYSQTLAVVGGVSPYTWSLAPGDLLPSGLTLSAAGDLSGIPTLGGTFSFTVGVADSSSGSTSKAFSLTVTAPAAPTASVAITDPSPLGPAQQPTFDVVLSAAYPLTITGTVTLTFTPNAVNAANDPAIQFSGGGRTLNFTIAAGQTRAFPTTLPSIQTGTVAGQIDMTLSFSAGGVNITPAPAPVRSVTIARAAPKINTVQVVKVTGGFNILVTGYSTPRQVTQAVFTFTPSTGANLQTTQVTVPMDSAFTTWYTGSSSAPFGSSFLYTQPFTVQGSVSDILSVSVTVSNATGTSAAVSANF